MKEIPQEVEQKMKEILATDMEEMKRQPAQVNNNTRTSWSDVASGQKHCDRIIAAARVLHSVASVFEVFNNREITDTEYKGIITSRGGVIKKDTPSMEKRIEGIRRKEKLVRNGKYFKRYSG